MTEAKKPDLEDVLSEYTELGHRVILTLVEADCIGTKYMTKKKLLKGAKGHEANLAERLLNDLVKHGFALSKKNGWLITLNPQCKTELLSVTMEHKQFALAKKQ